MPTNNHFSFLRLISKTISITYLSICWCTKLVKTLAGIDPSKPPLCLFISSQKGWWKPGIKNCAVGKHESSLVSTTIKMSTYFEIKLDIFLNLFQTEFMFRYEKIIFLGFLKRKFFISEISEWLSKELSSSLINTPSSPVIIQSTGKDLTNLHKFLAIAAIPFLFRGSLPLFRHDPSIFELSIKFMPA